MRVKRFRSWAAGVAVALAFFGLAAALPARAQQTAPRISLIRDAEIETIIRAYAAPVFAAAGLSAGSIRVHLVSDSAINAFVAGGLNLFMNTGLLLRAENANQVIGVIAHEAGHLAGGHLARTREAMRNATIEGMIAMALGMAAAVAGGRPEGAGAAMLGGIQLAERSFLAYSREMESSADQAALTFLERAHISSRGLQEFLTSLFDQELISVGRQDPYLRSHPITRERVDHVRTFLLTSRYADVPIAARFAEMHQRMRAKLLGFIDPDRALQQYGESDRSIPARYARAIAFYRKAQTDRAIALMDGLIRERPNDPYFQEMKAQILLEAGRAADSLPFYQRAVQLLPDEPLLRTELGAAQIQTGRADQIRAAIATLERSRQLDNTYGETWRLLAIAYGRDGQIGMASLAQAELEAINHEWIEARQFADRALRDLPRGSAAALRAQDLRANADRESQDPAYRRERRNRR